ncbi:MAG: SDR family NAD(P)-dependent oxidoreductase [Gammaproteobacteria bacterium]|jgi:short-subunit dehydrogenase|nr:SDR family NAD(P)-dependent oxidoreductase [Gammaproteobacteria bacterium]HJP04958.1 SDR family NAD(P)-dependent oxidoreductase [Gammaproteobacteria bacterium]
MIIWITGASSGLGRELARQYAKAGHKVCVSARSVNTLNELADACQNMPGRIYTFPLDVTDTNETSACLKQISELVGRPNLSVLNAGTHTENSVKGFDRDTYQRLMDVNYMGVVNCLQAIIPVYAKQREGEIAVVASVAGYRGLPNASAYAASKAALISLCESLQPELAAVDVSLRLINPGFVRTPLTDLNNFHMPFLMEVEDAATRIVKGLEGDRFEITFPRRFTWLLKLLRILPYAVYLKLTRKLLRDA